MIDDMFTLVPTSGVCFSNHNLTPRLDRKTEQTIRTKSLLIRREIPPEQQIKIISAIRPVGKGSDNGLLCGVSNVETTVIDVVTELPYPRAGNQLRHAWIVSRAGGA